MEIYVEHQNWRRLKRHKKFVEKTVVKFKDLFRFEKYVLNNHEKYPDYDVTYDIYECTDGRGSLLAKLHYKNKKFQLICIHNKWRTFCNQ